jgi:hypothetical protein
MNPSPPNPEEMADDEIDEHWQCRVYGTPFAVTLELKALLDERKAQHRSNPDDVIPNEVVMAELEAVISELRVKSAEHDASFRAAIQEALDDPRPLVPNAEVKAQFAKLRSDALSPRPANKKLNF